MLRTHEQLSVFVILIDVQRVETHVFLNLRPLNVRCTNWGGKWSCGVRFCWAKWIYGFTWLLWRADWVSAPAQQPKQTMLPKKWFCCSEFAFTAQESINWGAVKPVIKDPPYAVHIGVHLTAEHDYAKRAASSWFLQVCLCRRVQGELRVSDSVSKALWTFLIALSLAP